jgi:hypothetical protein
LGTSSTLSGSTSIWIRAVAEPDHLGTAPGCDPITNNAIIRLKEKVADQSFDLVRWFVRKATGKNGEKAATPAADGEDAPVASAVAGSDRASKVPRSAVSSAGSRLHG